MLNITANNSVVRQLQLVFSLSILLLLISLGASFYSIRQLIANSERVNHTNRVLIEAENIISYMKDAETGQRGYLVTLDTLFLQPYTGSYEKVTASYNQLRDLTIDNPAQQENLAQAKALYEAKFSQMRRIIDLTERAGRGVTGQYGEMLRGKKIMDDLRVVISRLRTLEEELLRNRIGQQQTYITYTPFLLVIAALISILITVFTYGRIKKDMDTRIAEQQDTEEKYLETTSRITAMEGVTRKIADGDYAVRSPDRQEDELGRIAKALNRMAESLEQTFADLTTRDWLQTGTVNLSDAIRGEKDVKKLATRLIDTLTDYLDAPIGTMYLLDTDGHYTLAGNHAVQHVPTAIRPGEGLIGHVIERKKSIVVPDVPPDYSRITSSLGAASPVALLIAPLLYDNVCVGVIEVGLLQKPTQIGRAHV